MATDKSVIEHIFLPPKLPQSDNGVAFEALLATVLKACTAYTLLRADSPFDPSLLRSTAQMLGHMQHVHMQDFVDEEKLAKLLVDLPPNGGPLPLYIKAQNAAVLISKTSSVVRFQVFELSPLNEAVYATEGRLRRSFPGSAIDVDLQIFQEEGFVTTVAHTLAKMSQQPVAGMQPGVRKANQQVDEDRDTTHPGMVSELFVGFLASVGTPAQAKTIAKTTREEVLWRDARSPWRRSPVWLLLRVALQLTLPLDMYKELMVYTMSTVLHENQALPSDLRYAMMAKIARRVVKLRSAVNPEALHAIRDILQCSKAALEGEWRRHQTQDLLDLSQLAKLDFEQDELTLMPTLDEYIKSIRTRQNRQLAAEFEPVSGLKVSQSENLPQLSLLARDEYLTFNLHAFETWVAMHMNDWPLAHKRDAGACGQLHALLNGYHGLASGQYNGNPEGLSISHLTTLELWMALDICATSLCPLLLEYKSGLSMAFLENLLLPRRGQMTRLWEIEQHFAHREAGARRQSYKLFCDRTPESFPATYFDQAPDLRALLVTITTRAEREKAAKLEELERSKNEYDRLTRLRDGVECQYVEIVIDWVHDISETRHSSACQRCSYQSQAQGMRIRVHEWPLPTNVIHEKVVVFELGPPPAFGHWRDCLSFLAINVLQGRHASERRASPSYPLSGDGQLSRFSLVTTSQRIGLLTQDKSHLHTHRKDQAVATATAANVCLNNGLNYTYHDHGTGFFISSDGVVPTYKTPLSCTYTLPQRSKALQQFVFRPAASPHGMPHNAVIASLSDCPDHMSLDEYKKLATLPCGFSLQWPNILIQLGFPAINFKKAESTLVILQCIYQAGPCGDGILRAGHAFLGDNNSATKLLDELCLALQRIKQNWESSQALSVFSSIASRLLSMCSSPAIQSSCLALLEDLRATAFQWALELREKARKVNGQTERAEYLSKRAKIALICIDTFNVGHTPSVNALAAAAEQASVLVQCMIIVQESRTLLASSSDPIIPLLLLRSRRLLYECNPILAANSKAIDDGIVRSWAGFRPGNPWSTAAAGTHWLTTTSQAGDAGSTLRVHFNTLDGELLVNGLPLDRLPRKYVDHRSYRTLFGDSTIEIMPTEMAGMDFAAKDWFAGHQIVFGMHTRPGVDAANLLVQAVRDDKRYELLPSDLLLGLFPAAFIEDHVHWYDLDLGVVEFRPAMEPWTKRSSQTWVLARDPSGSWKLTKDDASHTLLSLTSSTATALASILSSLADEARIHVVASPARGESLLPLHGAQNPVSITQQDWNASPRQVEVEIPGLQLSFRLQAEETDLQCKEFPDMSIDAKYASNDSSNGNTHVEVRIQKSVTGIYHTFRVDDTLGRLVGNGNLHSQLFLAYLHGLTTFCLPDPLTSKTGTEQALSILRSAEVRSFDRLTQENIALLQQIAALTPVRRHCPAHMRVMQTIHWSSSLGFLAQHAGFRTEVLSILEQATRSAIFHPSMPAMPVLPESDHMLSTRDAIPNAMLRVSGFGAEDFNKARDATYDPRDRERSTSRFINAFALSSLVAQRRVDLQWPLPSDMAECLWAEMSTTIVAGRDSVGLPQMRYDAILVSKPLKVAVYPHWMGLLRYLSAKANRFLLMMWLSTLACSNASPRDIAVLQLLALSFTRPELGHVELSPPRTSFRLHLGRTVESQELRDAITKLLVGFKDAPKFAIARGLRESLLAFGNRRMQVYTSKTFKIVNHILAALVAQWPCSRPDQPNLSGLDDVSTYLSITKVMDSVGPIFQAWHNNHEFYGYLVRIARTVSTLAVEAVAIPSLSLTYTMAMDTESSCYVKQVDFFAGTGPTAININAADPSVKWLTGYRSSGSSDGRLDALMTSIRASAAESAYEKAYVADLEASVSVLSQSGNETGLLRRDTIRQDLDSYLRICKDHVGLTYDVLAAAASPTAIALDPESRVDQAYDLWSMGQWPRVSLTFFLEQLNRSGWPLLGETWRDAIVQYALALTAMKRAERLVTARRTNSQLDLVSELRNTGHVNWSPHEWPETLLLEVESGVLIREVQRQVAGQMRNPQCANGHNAVMQLHMGEGKSSVIVPIVAASLADGSQLLRVIVAKPQSKQMAQMLIQKLGGLLDRRIYYMPFSRALNPSTGVADTIHAMLQECKSAGGVLLVQPEHLLSFKLMALESAVAGEGDTSRALLRTQDFFDQSSRDIVDESDENFSVKFELIYTIGTHRPVDMSPSRWQVIHEVLELTRTVSATLSSELPGLLERTHCLRGRFPRTQILHIDAQSRLIDEIAMTICKNGLHGFPVARQTQEIRAAVLTYITKFDLTSQEILAVQQAGDGTFWTESTTQSLLLLRGLLAAGVLPFVLGQKRWRVNYGLDSARSPPTKLAVPYRAKDSPSARAEYAHPDVVIALTTLSYYYGGLSEDDLATAFSHLVRSDQAGNAYEAWVRDADDMPMSFRHLEGVNLRDKHQFTSELLPRLRYGKATVDYFLANIVFPKEMREFLHKLSSSGWDLGKQKALPTTGFSGTNDSRTVLPLYVQQMDLHTQKHTNALALGYLLQEANGVESMAAPVPAQTAASDAERLLQMVMKLVPPARVILDVGAQILELSNLGVAKRWLELSDASVQAIVFFDEHDELSVINRKHWVEILQTSSYATQLDVCLVFLDESHTRGTDLRLPEHYRAAVTLGAGLTKDRLTQACMRMRKLGKGQTVVFCVPAEIEAKILQRTSKPAGSRIEVSDIIHWTISETWADMRRCMPLWATQGERFVRQNALWEHAQDSNGRTSLTQQQAEAFLEDEAQSLKARYQPSPDGAVPFLNSDEGDLGRIKKRCLEFEDLSFSSTTLQEEQERELSPENEREQQVEKPAPAKARKHEVHRDLINFVKTGVLPPGSPAWQPAFTTLSSTRASSSINLGQLRGDAAYDILATVDFAYTIEVKTGGAKATTDSHQRPVQWILTSVRDGKVVNLIIISPFEAQVLFPSIQTSRQVVMHLYTPRSNGAFRSVDRLDFYSVPHLATPLDIHPRLITQLNLFAGQLYISSYEDFLFMCSYLGLATEMAAEGWEVAADGFIIKDGQGRVGGAGSRLTKSPVKFLEALMSIRRDGEGISRTHMGALLEGKLLRAEDFAE
ncbi:hypothetical protein LTR53_003724 [Teratosphaeriaceae sp. CCFEE 6253]|nr:hypothetical protein LTR53_003724 [Teratosphaeriaceae sp. CCFEE 6253]